MMETRVFTVISLFVLAVSQTVNGDKCPLWHVEQMERCQCISTSLGGLIKCNRDSLRIAKYICLTWDERADSVYASYCLFIPMDHKACKRSHYEISINMSGPELNKWMCSRLNRQGAQCKQCISGYGPAALSDGVSCADCSKRKYWWILNLSLQLLCLTILFVVVTVLQIKGTASPWNIIITYSQLVVNAVTYDVYLRNHIECFIGKKASLLLITSLGILNLDFFRLIIPPLCISSSLKRIDTLFFDYIIALYPILITVLLCALIELHDHNCKVVVIASIPLRRLYHCFHTRWDPKRSTLSTFATFLLMSYSKLLFVSCNFLIAVQSYTCSSTGEVMSNSTVLLYDPNIQYFKSHHTPYIIIALIMIVLFILIPPLLLLFYPTRLFRKLLTCCGFRRWDILHMIMDTFQGWYKDGTEGTYDYRSLSALYMLLRVALVGEYLTVIALSPRSHGDLKWFITGSFHLLLGTCFLMSKPYKKKWMNIADALVLLLIGFYCCMNTTAYSITKSY